MNDLSQRELLNAQLSAEETDNSKSTSPGWERKHLDRTPFWIIGEPGQYFLAMGNNRLTGNFQTQDAVENYVANNLWECILAVCVVVTKQILSDDAALKQLFTTQTNKNGNS